MPGAAVTMRSTLLPATFAVATGVAGAGASTLSAEWHTLAAGHPDTGSPTAGGVQAALGPNGLPVARAGATYPRIFMTTAASSASH